MNITAETYYTTVIWVIPVLLIVGYVALAILWNKKFVPYQRLKGKLVKNFGATVKENLKIAFKEDDFTLFPKSKNEKLKKLASIKTINKVLLIMSAIMLAIHTNPILPGFNWEAAWLPALLFVILVWVRSAPIKNERNQILIKMFEIANRAFHYGTQAQFTPWNYVKVVKWNGSHPEEINITLPTVFDASTPTSREGFERHFNSTVTDQNTWVYEWKTVENVVIARPISHIPTMANYPGSEKHPWNIIPLGLGVQGEVTVDLSKSPHFLITGTTGSGKSVLQRNLIFHVIQHNDMMRFLGVDLKRVELGQFRKYEQTVLGIGTTLEHGVEIIRYVKKIQDTRYEQMEAAGVNHFLDMVGPDGRPDYAIMLMIDEAYALLAPEGNKSDEGKVRDQLHAEASTLLGDLARLGRAAGIHLVVATQRPDAKVIMGEFKQNLAIRVLAGRADSTASAMTLDSGAGTMLPAIKGRGIVSVYGEAQQFQGYFAPAEWIDEWLARNPGREPTLYPLTNGNTSTHDEEDAELREGMSDIDLTDETSVMGPVTDESVMNDTLPEIVFEDDDENKSEPGRETKEALPSVDEVDSLLAHLASLQTDNGETDNPLEMVEEFLPIDNSPKTAVENNPYIGYDDTNKEDKTEETVTPTQVNSPDELDEDAKRTYNALLNFLYDGDVPEEELVPISESKKPEETPEPVKQETPAEATRPTVPQTPTLPKLPTGVPGLPTPPAGLPKPPPGLPTPPAGLPQTPNLMKPLPGLPTPPAGLPGLPKPPTQS